MGKTDLFRFEREAKAAQAGLVIAGVDEAGRGHFYGHPKKSRELLHWTARRTLKDMCADAWRWQQNNPCGYES